MLAQWKQSWPGNHVNGSVWSWPLCLTCSQHVSTCRCPSSCFLYRDIHPDETPLAWLYWTRRPCMGHLPSHWLQQQFHFHHAARRMQRGSGRARCVHPCHALTLTASTAAQQRSPCVGNEPRMVYLHLEGRIRWQRRPPSCYRGNCPWPRQAFMLAAEAACSPGPLLVRRFCCCSETTLCTRT